MNNLVNVTSHKVETMSSREIAELTGKAHADVMGDIRDIKAKSEKGDFLFEVIESRYQGSRRMEKCYLLPRRECEILVTC